jgi:hypothetical protein
MVVIEGEKPAIRWWQVAFHKRLFYEVCFGSRLRSDTLKGETTRGESRTTNRRATPAPPHKILYYKTRPPFTTLYLYKTRPQLSVWDAVSVGGGKVGGSKGISGGAAAGPGSDGVVEVRW